jgi:predicted nucleic acid-binding protein
MRLIDTSAWIEWLAASPTGERIGDSIPQRHEWLVPTIVQLELVKWLWREAGEDKADQVIAFTQLCVVATLDTPIALSAADISIRHRLATADAVIYATALAYGAELITCDAHFEGLPGVKYIAKVTA